MFRYLLPRGRCLLHIFRHEVLCYLFPHGRCSVCNFSGMRYFISCLYFFSLVYKYILVCDVFVASLPMLDSTYFVTLDACLMYKWFAGGMFMLI